MASEHPPASERVRREWRDRVVAEYRSAAITQHLTLWMTQAGLSPDLLREGLRIAEDELEHSKLSNDVYLAAGGRAQPELDRATLGLPEPPDEPLEHRLVASVVRIFCLGETIAVPLFRHLRERCTVDVSRRALDRILADEGRHRAFGWDTLDLLIEVFGLDIVRDVVEPRLGAMLEGLDASYGSGAIARDRGTTTDADRAWGVVPAAEFATIFASTVDAVWVPRFSRLGITVDLSWSTEHRGSSSLPR